jgi:hypothetical protein
MIFAQNAVAPVFKNNIKRATAKLSPSTTLIKTCSSNSNSNNNNGYRNSSN